MQNSLKLLLIDFIAILSIGVNENTIMTFIHFLKFTGSINHSVYIILCCIMLSMYHSSVEPNEFPAIYFQTGSTVIFEFTQFISIINFYIRRLLIFILNRSGISSYKSFHINFFFNSSFEQHFKIQLDQFNSVYKILSHVMHVTRNIKIPRC